MSVTVEQSWQQMLNNHANDFWTTVPVTVEHSYQWLLNIPASDCWTIVAVTVEQLCQWLLNNCASNSEQSYQWQLNNIFFWCFCCLISTSKCPWGNACLKILFRVSLCHINTGQLIAIRDKLAGFSMVRFLLECIYEQTVVYIRKCLSVETCTIQKPVNWFSM